MVRNKLQTYFVVGIRVLIGATLIGYGLLKLFRIQFSIPNEILAQPLAEVDLFTLSWYLADHEPFRTCVGITEVATGLMFLVKKLFLIASIVSVAIWVPILLFDLTFMGHDIALITFVVTMISLTISLILVYRRKLLDALKVLMVP